MLLNLPCKTTITIINRTIIWTIFPKRNTIIFVKSKFKIRQDWAVIILRRKEVLTLKQTHNPWIPFDKNAFSLPLLCRWKTKATLNLKGKICDSNPARSFQTFFFRSFQTWHLVKGKRLNLCQSRRPLKLELIMVAEPWSN